MVSNAKSIWFWKYYKLPWKYSKFIAYNWSGTGNIVILNNNNEKSFIVEFHKIVFREKELFVDWDEEISCCRTSSALIWTFKKPVVYTFLNFERKEKHCFLLHQIFDIDQTGICTVQMENSKVIVQTGPKQVGRDISAQRGNKTTAVIRYILSRNFLVSSLFKSCQISVKDQALLVFDGHLSHLK